MPDSPDKYRKESYWIATMLPEVDVCEAYDTKTNIITADELLQRWQLLEPYELALIIYDEIKYRLAFKPSGFPITYTRCKSRKNDEGIIIHYLRFTYTTVPYKYFWDGDSISFDFSNIVFDMQQVLNFEHEKPSLLNKRIEEDEAPYVHTSLLRKHFPVEKTEEQIISHAIQKQSEHTSKPKQMDLDMSAVTISPPQEASQGEEADPLQGRQGVAPERKNMQAPNQAKKIKTENRWKEQIPSLVAATLFCVAQFRKTGERVPQKDYTTELERLGLPELLEEANASFASRDA